MFYSFLLLTIITLFLNLKYANSMQISKRKIDYNIMKPKIKILLDTY